MYASIELVRLYSCRLCVCSKALALAAESDDPTLPRSKMTHLLKIGLNHESRSLWEKDYLFETDGDGVSLLVKRLMVRTAANSK